DLSGDYVFPNLRSGTGLTPVTVIDNETAGLITIESGVGTLVVRCGNSTCTVAGPTDDYFMRLTKRPDGTVGSAILTDGLVDVQSVGGVAIDYTSLADPILQPIGGYVPTRLFAGNLSLANASGHATLTRTNGSELGSFVEEGFEAGQLIRIGGAGAGFDGQYYVDAVTHTLMTL